MAELKPHEYERLMRSSASLPRILLFFGPDRGLVSERAIATAKRTGISLEDPFAVTHLDASDIQKDPGLLGGEMNSLGLFGGDRLVWIKGASNEKPLVEFLQDEKQIELSAHTWLIVEAGDLKKASALRKAAAGSRAMVSVACYSDDLRGLGELVDDTLKSLGKRISPDARALLLENLGADRMASRAEINKLMLYCQHDSLIEEHHVAEIIGDASTASVDDAIDALLAGDQLGVVNATKKVLASKTGVYQLLNAVLRQFQQLDLLRTEADARGLPPARAVADYGKHIFFKRKPLVTQALHAWTAPKLKREMQRLQSTILQCQRSPAVAEAIALQLMLSLSLQSKPRRANG